MDYYNENDPYCGEWLCNLMDMGLINRGVVDVRSIEDVTPNDLRGFNQCHFFAGIGIWAYALRNAGWGDRRGIWTGSCPCQPFSDAGEGKGFADERHLWPAWYHLISVCRPPLILGEQVASKDGLAWLDLVSSDLQGAHYASGPVDICGAGFGAPHIRQRIYFGAVGVGDSIGAGLEGYAWDGDYAQRWALTNRPASPDRSTRPLADDIGQRRLGGPDAQGPAGEDAAKRIEGPHQPECDCITGRIPYTLDGAERSEIARTIERFFPQSDGDLQTIHGDTGPTNGFWRFADWLLCRDGKWRAVEPGSFPLAYGATARVGRLRAYGNAIMEPVAREFILAVRQFVEAIESGI